MENNFFKSMVLGRLEDRLRWLKLEKLFIDNYINREASSIIRIPKIIHQIWLGGDIPNKYTSLCESWKKFNPGWDYYLWSDCNIKNLTLVNKKAFESTKNLGAKSDILRYEILYKYGGIYVDTDFECLKSFDDIHCSCDFYAGLLSQEKPTLLNGLIGCTPGNRLMKRMIENLTEQSNDSTKEILDRTGPHYFTESFFAWIEGAKEKSVIFPAAYFYPSPNSNCGRSEDSQKEYLQPDSMAIHYWYISWMKSSDKWFLLIIKAVKNFLPYGIVKLFSK